MEHCGWYVRVCKQKPRFRGRTYFNKMFFGPHTKLPCIIYSIAELNILENEYWSFDVAKLDGQSILVKKEIKWALFTSHSGFCSYSLASSKASVINKRLYSYVLNTRSSWFCAYNHYQFNKVFLWLKKVWDEINQHFFRLLFNSKMIWKY